MSEAVKTCPLGHECHACLWNKRIRGLDPQSGQELDREECAINLIALLGIEGNMYTQQVTATLDGVRNAVLAVSAPDDPRLITQ